MSIEIGPPIQESEVPEANDTLKLAGILRKFGKVTTDSRIAGAEGAIQRPLALRTTRAKLYELALQSDKAKRGEILREAHARDEIARQYLNQGSIQVDLPGLGEQNSQYTIINPPESLKGPEVVSHPPIFIIPGISNDIDCIGGLALELPMSNRGVTVVGFPDSFMGSVTGEFADAMTKTNNFDQHTQYFKEAINGLMGDNDFELWGHSTGSAIAAEILNDPDFQRRVTNAVLIAPAGSVDQTKAQVTLGFVQEVGQLVKRFSVLGRYTKTSGRGEHIDPERPEQRKLKVKVFNSLIEKVSRKHDAYKTAKVKDGGSVMIVSGNKDKITRSVQSLAALRVNPQIKILELPNASHLSPLMEPEKVIPEIFKLQKSPQAKVSLLQ